MDKVLTLPLKCSILIPCQVFSRICGYYQPLGAWNEGKKAEFEDRSYYNVDNYRSDDAN